MLWVFVLASSTWLGYELVPFFKVNDLSFIVRLFSGWLLGVEITSIFLYIANFILPFSILLVIITCVLLSIAAFYAHHRGARSQFKLNFTPWFLVLILFTCGASLKHLSKIYGNAPQQIPEALRPIMDRELSFISSILYGYNRRRHNIFFYEEPLMYNNKFYGYSMPLLYTSALIRGGLSYGSASIIICFMNTISVVVATYNFAKKYTQWATLSACLILFSGSWATFLFFKAKNRLDPSNDLVHRMSEKHITCWYQMFAQLLSFSKATSFSVAYAQYAIFWQSTTLGPLLAACCPSLATTLATLATLVGMPGNTKVLSACAATVLLRLYPFTFTYKPMFREAEMRGTFFAPAVIWFNALGPIFVVLALFFWKLPKGTFKFYFIASVSPFLILNFFREGKDHLNNACAIASTTYPIAVVAFVELMRRFIHYPQDEENKGIAIFFMSALVAFLFVGGLITSKRIELPYIDAYTAEDMEVVEWLKKIPKKSVIYSEPNPLSPISLSGRRQFIGDKEELFSYGANINRVINKYYKLQNSDNETVWRSAGVTHILTQKDSKIQLNVTYQTVNSNNKYTLGKI